MINRQFRGGQILVEQVYLHDVSSSFYGNYLYALYQNDDGNDMVLPFEARGQKHMDSSALEASVVYGELQINSMPKIRQQKFRLLRLKIS